MTPTEALDPIAEWTKVSGGLPYDIPKDAYDAQREQFIKGVVEPWALQRGHNTEAVRQEFLRKTERSESPKWESFKASAEKAFLDPVLGLTEQTSKQERVRQQAEHAKAVAGTSIPAMLGEGVGAAPYWAPFLGVGGAAGEAANLGKIGMAGARSVAGGAAQSAYDALRAQDGHRLKAGLEGFPMGAGMVAGAEGLFAIPGLLKRGLSPQVAKSVENAVKGAPDFQGQAAIAADPSLADDVMQHLAEQVKVAQKAGLPKDAFTATPGAPLTVKMKAADGKVYPVGGTRGVPPEALPSLMDLISGHLDQGGEIISADGDAKVLRQFQMELDRVNQKRGLYDVPTVSKDGGLIETKPPVSGPNAEGESPPSEDSSLSQIPTYDQIEQLPSQGLARNRQTGQIYNSLKEALAPEPTTAPNPLKGEPSGVNIERGSSSIPLLPEGKLQMHDAGDRYRELGFGSQPGDHIRVPSLARSRESGQILADRTGAPIADINPNLNTWSEGQLEGQPEALVQAEKDRLRFESPDEAPPGMGPLSTAPGEAYNAYLRRFLPEMKRMMDSIEQNPEQRILTVNHMSGIKAVQAWMAKGMPDDFSVDAEELARPDGDPGDAHQLQYADGKWTFNKSFDLGTADELPNSSIYINRHGLTAFNGEAAPRNLVEGDAADALIPVGGRGASFSGEGTPTIALKSADDLTSLRHEWDHTHIGVNGLRDMFSESDPFAEKLHGAFSPETRAFYGDSMNEETWVHFNEALQSGNEEKIQRFVDADESKARVMDWFASKTQAMLDRLAEQPDSVYRSYAEKSFTNSLQRATPELETLHRTSAAPYGDTVTWEDGRYVVERGDGTRLSFDQRERLVSHLEANYSQPVATPELVDTAALPKGVPRYAVDMIPPDQRPPRTNLPRDPESLPVEAGWYPMSNLFRPHNAWIDDVATKLGRPDLFDASHAVKLAETARKNWLRDYFNIFKETFQGFKDSRFTDVTKWMETAEADKAKIESELHFTSDEIAAMRYWKQTGSDRIGQDLGIDPQLWIEDYAPRWRRADFDPTQLKPSYSNAPNSAIDFFAEHARTGDLDPRELNYRTIMANYLELGSKKKFLSEPLKNMADLVNQKDSAGNYVFGTMQPVLARHVEYMRGQPDFTHKLMNGVIQAASNWINKGLAKLPGEPQINLGRDALAKFIKFGYMGALALRPMVPIRDAMMLFITTYPVLGARYLARGMADAFRGGADLWDEALREGALLDKSDLINYATGSGDSQIGKWSEKLMEPIRIGHNSNRLIAYAGNKARILDALADGVDETFAKRSGLYLLDTQIRNKLLAEAQAGISQPLQEGFARRAAKELVDISQWDLQRGSQPGFAKWGLGKLFGQYGSYPMNYIEFARRLARSGDLADRAQMLTRLVLAHGAILKAGEMAGVDTSHWVFTQPMAFTGSPAFRTLSNLPGALDFQSQRGDDARRNITDQFTMQIPGGNAAARIYRAIVNDDPDLEKIIFGFSPLKPGDANKGWHGLIPGPEN